MLFETSRENIDGHNLLIFGTAVKPMEGRWAFSSGFWASICCLIRFFADQVLLTIEPIMLAVFSGKEARC